MDGYQLLANAIIRQAADDYLQLLMGCNLKEIERFFHSEWFGILTDVDPDYLMKKLKEKAGK